MLPVHIFGQYAVQEDTLWFGFASDSAWLARLGSSGSRGIQWLKSPIAGTLLSGSPDSLHAIALELKADWTVDWNARRYCADAPPRVSAMLRASRSEGRDWN